MVQVKVKEGKGRKTIAWVYCSIPGVVVKVNHVLVKIEAPSPSFQFN